VRSSLKNPLDSNFHRDDPPYVSISDILVS
jgi:hypothetical protein